MRVLIVCEKFAPENTVGAIRMTKVAKYLKLNHQCEITVLLRERQQYFELGDAKCIDHFVYARESWLCNKVIAAYKKYSSSDKYDEINRKDCKDITSGNKKKNFVTRLKEYLKSILAVLYSEYTPRSYCRNAMRQVKKQHLKFDVVISSFGPAASHYIGKRIKAKQPNVLWIADYRDPLAIGETTKGFLHGWALSFAKRMTGMADAITVASKGFISCLNLVSTNEVYAIRNGFDKDDYKGILTIDSTPHKKMRLVYTGTLFAGSRDISIILKAFKELIDEGLIDSNRLEIIYVGQHKKEFIYQFERSGLEIDVDANDVVPKNDALKLQNSADLLLLAAWNTNEYRGSLPLKVYEYLYTGKPIICAVCGTAANSEIKHIIDACDGGICYEAANHNTDYQILKNKLIKYYREYLKYGYVPQHPEGINKEAVSAYNYENIAEQFYQIIQKGNRK